MVYAAEQAKVSPQYFKPNGMWWLHFGSWECYKIAVAFS